MITAIHHVQITIPPGAEDQARAFYCGVLGLREIEKPASLAGRVFADPENDGQFGSLDTPLSGVVIELLNAQGVVVQTTHTNTQGQYNFTNLQPGTYSVREKQPSGYYDGGEKVATGLYIWVAEGTSGSEKRGKLAVIR